MNSLRSLLAVSLLAVSVASHADQPNMEAALASLQQAKESLQKATADKGGHRVKAMKSVDAAIAEVKAGIAYAKKNAK